MTEIPRRYRPLPNGFADRITTEGTVHLGFVDRLKVLLGEPVTIRVEHTCEHSPGKVEPYTFTEPLLWPWVRWWRVRQFRHRVGYCVVEEASSVNEGSPV